jgi:NADH-quinone oxidoreductase subunit E
MTHYILELAIWLLLAYFIGCLVGWALRNIMGQGASQPATAAAMSTPASAVAARAAPVHITTPTPLSAAPVATDKAAAVATGKMERPKGITAARSGKADNLQRISGVGPKNEGILNNLGIYHFDQIAAWTPEHVTWVDDHLRFNGRIQASLLATGKEAEFTKEFGTGGMKNKQGETVSGTRTRKT